jgi:hypothetical protein
MNAPINQVIFVLRADVPFTSLKKAMRALPQLDAAASRVDLSVPYIDLKSDGVGFPRKLVNEFVADFADPSEPLYCGDETSVAAFLATER